MSVPQLVVKTGAVATTSSSGAGYAISFVPESTVQWQALSISSFMTRPVISSTGSWGGKALHSIEMDVDEVDVMEFVLAWCPRDNYPALINIPLHGITFSGAQSVRVKASQLLTNTCRCCATFWGYK